MDAKLPVNHVMIRRQSLVGAQANNISLQVVHFLPLVNHKYSKANITLMLVKCFQLHFSDNPMRTDELSTTTDENHVSTSELLADAAE